jgi:hypothetical protein
MYKDRYGNYEAITRTFAEDPVGAAADLSTLLSGGGAVASKLGAVETGAAMSRMGAAINPMRPIAPVIEAPEGLTVQDVADGMGVEKSGLVDAINAQIDDFNKGFDKGLLLGGMTATPMQINLPQPKEFFDIPKAVIAAAMKMPQKILIGNEIQTK